MSNGRIGKWLGAACSARRRATALEEFVVVDGEVLGRDGGATRRKLRAGPGPARARRERCARARGRGARAGDAVIVFCASRKLCEASAERLAALLAPDGDDVAAAAAAAAAAPSDAAGEDDGTAAAALSKQWRALAERLPHPDTPPALRDAVARAGVGFHHAALAAAR